MNQWGAATGGLQTRIWTKESRRTFLVGQSILVFFEIRNASDQDQIVMHQGFWPNNRVEVFAGAELAKLTPLGKRRRDAFQNQIHEKTSPKNLPPGAVDSAWEPFDLSKMFDLSQPGEYKVRVVHDSVETVASNELTFQIARD